MRFAIHQVVVIALAGLAPIGAQARPATPDSVIRVLKQVERDLGDANVRRDKGFFERIEADEFLFTGSDGSVTTRQEDLASLERPSEAQLLSDVPDSMMVRVYGEAAVVWGRTTVAIRLKDGTVVTRQNRFTDLFVWRDKRWQLVAGHSSRIPVKQP